MSFSLDLKRFSKSIEVDLLTARRKITLDLLAKMTMRTPVDTGRARMSWVVSDDEPSSYVAAEGQGDATSGGKIEAAFTKPFGRSVITNNLPYIRRLEFGHSGQAPQGMVRVSIAEIKSELGSV